MSKRLITAAALMGLALTGSFARADSQDQRARRQLRNSFGLVVESSARDGQEGVAVSQVLSNSPAARAGLRTGDVILRVGSRSIEDFRDLAKAIARYQRDRVSIRVERDGRDRTMHATLPSAEEDDQYGDLRSGRNNGEGSNGDSAFQRLEKRFRQLESRLQEMERGNQYGSERGESADQERDLQRLQKRLDQLEERIQQAQRPGRYGRNSSAMLGVQVREWRRQDDSPQGGSADEGVEVMKIDSDSPASEAGLRRGDIITRVDDRDVATRQELQQAWQRTNSGQGATLEVLRGGRQMDVKIRRESGSRSSGRGRRYERLQERIERLESRLREMEQNP